MLRLKTCGLVVLVAVLQLAVLTGSAADAPIRICGTPEMSKASAQAIQAELNQTMQSLLGTTNQTLAGQRLASNARTASKARVEATTAKPATGIVVNVFFHVLNQGSAVADGNIPDSMVQAQLSVRRAGSHRTHSERSCTLVRGRPMNSQCRRASDAVCRRRHMRLPGSQAGVCILAMCEHQCEVLSQLFSTHTTHMSSTCPRDCNE